MTSEQSKRNVYLLLVVINKVAIVSHNKYSWVIFLEGRKQAKSENTFSSEDNRRLCCEVIVFKNINPKPGSTK